MAAKTPGTLTQHRASASVGYVNPQTGNGKVAAVGWHARGSDVRNEKLRIFVFDDWDNGDTWASGLDGVSRWATYETSGAVGVNATHSAGTFTFITGTDSVQVILYVWTNS